MTIARTAIRVVATLAAFLALAPPAAAQSADPPRNGMSPTAEAIYAAAKPRLIQVRTLVATADRQSSIGSGFLVDADGLALTNYHVVSQFALEPSTYKLEYVDAGGRRGSLTLLAIDIAEDLAVVRIDRPADTFLEFDPRSVAGRLPHGERLFSLGNPLDLGFTIVEGTYNGLVEKSYARRLHFSGAINPGMSGGPTVAADGRIAGVNVAKRLDGELVSFLVPAAPAAALVERARSGAPLTVAQTRAEITTQLDRWQAGLFDAMTDVGFKPARYGAYTAPESKAAWLSCWARTNADAIPKPRALIATTSCSTRTWLFLAGDLQTGLVDLSYSYVDGVSLNAFQFAALLTEQSTPSRYYGAGSRKRLTPQRCEEQFVSARAGDDAPTMRATLCARAYRDFPGLYDVSVTAVTQDDARHALVARLSLRGASWHNATAFAQRFLSDIARAP
jgi:S1-C subfamily serine protease